MYTVIGTVRTRTARVLWMLEELGLPYEHIAAGPRSAEVRAVNPGGKVPVLLVDGVAISDSTAILQFLADRHGRFTHPAGSIDRARQDSLTQFVLDEFDALLWTASRHSFILPEEHRLPAIKDSLRWEFARSQTALVARMGEGPFLMGEAMTVPDLILTHCGLWAGAAQFPITEPQFAGYLEAMRARPALVKALSL
jgi:glutathione S-transferase